DGHQGRALEGGDGDEDRSGKQPAARLVPVPERGGRGIEQAVRRQRKEQAGEQGQLFDAKYGQAGNGAAAESGVGRADGRSGYQGGYRLRDGKPVRYRARR